MSRFASYSALATLLLAAPLAAHDDARTILDARPPYQGPGFRAANPSSLGTPLAGMSSFQVELQSWLTLPELGAGILGIDIWGYVSPSGREYAIMGTSSATVFVEVSDPANAQVVGSIPGPGSAWRDSKTFGQYCYSVSEGGGGIQVIDLSAIDAGVVTLAGTVDDIQGNTHNVQINTDSGFLYRCGVLSTGVAIYDLNADPVNPPNVGFYSNVYVHDLQVVTMPSGPYAGREIAFMNTPSSLGGGLTIRDVTDKANMQTLGFMEYPGEQYSHQGWLSNDLQLFYLNDEQLTPASTIVIDVSDLTNPRWEHTFSNGIASNTHNCFIQGDLLYQANYSQGLRIFDLSVNAIQPPEVGHYDTFPENNSPGIVGLWGVYPYLPSGTILGSDRSRGLFVWKWTPPALEIAPASDAVTLLDSSGGQAIQVRIEQNPAGSLDPSSPTLEILSAGGPQSLPLVDLGGGLWEGTFPGLACAGQLAYRFDARTVGGQTFGSMTYEAQAFLSLQPAILDDFEVPSGWVGGLPSDTATKGVWELVDPVGTGVAPEDDHSPNGSLCWVTGQGAVEEPANRWDVDGGATTLVSPVYDLTLYDRAVVRYSAWFFSSDLETDGDQFLVRVSNNGGLSWTVLDTVASDDPRSKGGWFESSFQVADFLAVTDEVMFSFRARDGGGGSLVEAAIDDFFLFDASCYTGLGMQSCPAVPNSTGQPATIAASGSAAAADNDLVLTAEQLPPHEFGYFLTSMGQGFLPAPAGSLGNLCLSGTLGRFSGQIQSSGPAGSFSIQVDLSALPLTPSIAVQAGDTWRFQAWFRDNFLGQPVSNFTGLVSVEFD